MSSLLPPTRADVEQRWRAVISGQLSREEVSQWAEPLVFAEYDTEPDGMALSALQTLHGFDMTLRSEDGNLIGHGPPGPYYFDDAHIAAKLDRWLSNCAQRDADPVGWAAARRKEADAFIAERNRSRAECGD